MSESAKKPVEVKVKRQKVVISGEAAALLIANIKVIDAQLSDSASADREKRNSSYK